MISGIPLILGLEARMWDPCVYGAFWAPYIARIHKDLLSGVSESVLAVVLFEPLRGRIERTI